MTEASYNLLLVHSAGWQDVADFYALKTAIEALAPDIEVFIASNEIASSSTRKRAARRPTLVFSPIRLLTFKPDRGRIFAGRPMSKLAELAELSKSGLPIPAYEELTPDSKLTAARYGPLTVVKPSDAFASFGKGFGLYRTQDVRYRSPADFPEKHPGRDAPMIAQRFIDCGHPAVFRVLTLFGTPLFAMQRRRQARMNLPPELEVYTRKYFMPDRPGVDWTLSKDPEVIALATRAYAALPDVALQACDILREEATGDLYLLEVNPGGGTWMFSNGREQSYRKQLGIDDLWAPFDAMNTCARVLAERTRQDAA